MSKQKSKFYGLELLQVQPVANKTKDYYKLTIQDNINNETLYVELKQPNISKYCKVNNISTAKYNDDYNYNDIKVSEYIDLLGVIDLYIDMGNRKVTIE